MLDLSAISVDIMLLRLLCFRLTQGIHIRYGEHLFFNDSQIYVIFTNWQSLLE